MENLLQTGFERNILWKMANRHTYDIVKSTTTSKTGHYEGKCILENHLQKVGIELNSNFQLFHRYFFSKVCY